MLELVLGEAAFEEGARIDAGRGVTLHEHHVAGMLVRSGAPEMVEADLVQRGRGRVGGQMPAVLARDLVGIDTIANAFQRMHASMRFSNSRLPGYDGSWPVEMC
jgi:hypothetical protein